MDIRKLFKVMVEKEASDMFLSVGSTAKARINGIVQEIDSVVISELDMVNITNFLLGTDDQRVRFKTNKDVDFIHDDPEVGRFRVNVFSQRGTPALVARHVHTSVKKFDELHLPTELLTKLCAEATGLVLLCGPAGSGKSTTIASMIDLINAGQPRHIVTIEDPIEFLFDNKKSIVNQRELGPDVPSYPAALKHVTQQSPDIIYIGNIRDVETMRAAITATELGTFVVSTFHTINAVQTIVRIVNFFPPYLHDEVRLQLSTILKAVVSLRLLPLKDGSGRVPAYETMVVTPTISRLIREGKVNELQSFIDEGELYGMQSFKKSLVKLVQEGLVDEAEARRVADSKDEFNLELKGVKRYLE